MSIEFAPRVSNPITYDEALLYCMTLSYKGYNDWRLPRYGEPISWHVVWDPVVWIDDNDRYVKQHPTVTYPVTPVRDIK